MGCVVVKPPVFTDITTPHDADVTIDDRHILRSCRPTSASIMAVLEQRPYAERTQLHSIILQWGYIGDLEFNMFLSASASYHSDWASTLMTLTLEGCNLTDISVQTIINLGFFSAKHFDLRNVSLACNAITYASLLQILQYLAKHETKLQRLDLSSNQICFQDMALGPLIAHLSVDVETIDIQNNPSQPSLVRAFDKLMKHRKHYRKRIQQHENEDQDEGRRESTVSTESDGLGSLDPRSPLRSNPTKPPT
eukprot:PhF_6_TR7893/c0_g1_i1/m.11624